MTLHCPKCQQEATLAHLQSSPECMEALTSLFGLYKRAKRKTVTRAGGRPAIIKPCPRCGKPVSVTEARYGHQDCPTIPKGRRAAMMADAG